MPTSRASRIWFYQHLQVRRHHILDENNTPKAWCPSSDCHGHHVMSFHMHIHIHIYIHMYNLYSYSNSGHFICILKWIQSILRILIHVHNHMLYLYLKYEYESYPDQFFLSRLRPIITSHNAILTAAPGQAQRLHQLLGAILPWPRDHRGSPAAHGDHHGSTMTTWPPWP